MPTLESPQQFVTGSRGYPTPLFGKDESLLGEYPLTTGSVEG